jgi:hypothetical protein
LTIFTLLHPLCAPSLLRVRFTNRICFMFLSFIAYVPVHCPVVFCHGITPVKTLYFNLINLSITLLSPLSHSLLFTAFSMFCCALLLHTCDVFQYHRINWNIFSFSLFWKNLYKTSISSLANMWKKFKFVLQSTDY